MHGAFIGVFGAKAGMAEQLKDFASYLSASSTAAESTRRRRPDGADTAGSQRGDVRGLAAVAGTEHRRRVHCPPFVSVERPAPRP